MGKRGPKPARPDGMHVTAPGYLRGNINGRLRLQHRALWEAVHGPIPEGMQLHHINEVKTDNRLENLMLVDTTTHKRLHSGCELRHDGWWKPCGKCGATKPIDKTNWYLSKEGWPLYGRCRLCHIRIVCETSARRKQGAK